MTEDEIRAQLKPTFKDEKPPAPAQATPDIPDDVSKLKRLFQEYMPLLESLRSTAGAYARMYLGTIQSIPNNTTTLVNLDTVSFPAVGATVNTTSHRITISKAGYYIISAAVRFLSIVANKNYSITIKKNGTTDLSHSQDNGSTSNAVSAYVADVVKLEAGDYLELYCFQDSGGNLDIHENEARTFISIAKV